jgi:hypothetical protein
MLTVRNKRWSSAEIGFVRSNGRMDYREIATRLNRTLRSIRAKSNQLKLFRLKRWTDKEDALLLRLAKRESLKNVSLILGRDMSEASQRLKRLGFSLRQRTKRVFKHNSRGHGLVKGYWQTRKSDGLGNRVVTWEHIDLVESQIGRKLKAGELVHHINGLSADNDLDNLFLCSGLSEHQKIHRSLDNLLPWLIMSGIVVFSRKHKRYELCR